MVKHISKVEKTALNDFKKALLNKFGKDLLELKLFGSRARGDFKKIKNIGEASDIDVFIVLKKNSKSRESFIFEVSSEILLKYGIDISPKVFSERENREKTNLQIPFFLIVKEEGILL